jgi:hypothetical protein
MWDMASYTASYAGANLKRRVDVKVILMVIGMLLTSMDIAEADMSRVSAPQTGMESQLSEGK